MLKSAQLTGTDEDHIIENKDETTPEEDSLIEMPEGINRSKIDKLLDRAESEVIFRKVMIGKHAEELLARDR